MIADVWEIVKYIIGKNIPTKNKLSQFASVP